jgi:hypothetical protein
LHITTNTKLTTGNTNDQFVIKNVRRSGVGRTHFWIITFVRPDFFTGIHVQRDQSSVGLVQEDFAVSHRQTAVNGVTAHNGYGFIFVL